MKRLICRTSVSLLMFLFGIGELTVSADENTDSKPQAESSAAQENAAKAAANKKPRGLFADSFFWPSSGDASPAKAAPLAPPPVLGASEPPAVVPAATYQPVYNPAPPVVGAYVPSQQPPVQMPYQMPQQIPVQMPVQMPPQMPQQTFAQLPQQMPVQVPYQMPQQMSVQPAGWVTNVGQSEQQFVAQQAPISTGVTCSCSDGGCDSCDCCPDPLCCHRSGVFADFLYLRPGNIDYVYAVEQTGTLPTDVPTGPVGRVGFDTMPGYRIGVNHCLSECSSLQVSYAWFQATTSNTITADPNTVLIFQPGLPQIPNVGSSSIQTSANDAIRFQQLDIDYRGLLYGTCDSAVNYFAGVRYANLEQNFRAQEDIGVAVGLSQVRTDINFDGFGIGFGLDGTRRRANTGLLIYGRSSASFVSGEFKADYRQTTQFGPNSVVGNTLADYRVMAILQTELGLGWQSCCGRVKLTGGYQFAGWFNALTVGSYIPGVQNRQFSNLNETITFDGLVARVLVQF